MDLDHGATVSVDSYSPFTLNAVVGVTVAGVRKVEVTHGIGGLATKFTSTVMSGRPPEIDMDKLNEIDARLRTVEIDLSGIKERLNHMPTTNKMLVTMGSTGLLIVLGCWGVLTFAGPGIMKGAVKDLVAEHLAAGSSAVADKDAEVPQPKAKAR